MGNTIDKDAPEVKKSRRDGDEFNENKPDVSTYVFLGLTGSAHLSLDPCVLEISLLALQRQEVLLLAGQGLPRSCNRLTISCHPRRSIPIRVMQNTEILNSTAELNSVFCEKDITLINNFLDRLPKPVCLVSYSAEVYDYRLIRHEISSRDQRLITGLLCTSVSKAVRGMRPCLDSYEISDVYKVLCGKETFKSESAENMVQMLVGIVSHLPGCVGWMDTHNRLFCY